VHHEDASLGPGKENQGQKGQEDCSGGAKKAPPAGSGFPGGSLGFLHASMLATDRRLGTPLRPGTWALLPEGVRLVEDGDQQ
jgi:hypothetical protein